MPQKVAQNTETKITINAIVKKGIVEHITVNELIPVNHIPGSASRTSVYYDRQSNGNYVISSSRGYVVTVSKNGELEEHCGTIYLKQNELNDKLNYYDLSKADFYVNGEGMDGKDYAANTKVKLNEFNQILNNNSAIHEYHNDKHQMDKAPYLPAKQKLNNSTFIGK